MSIYIGIDPGNEKSAFCAMTDDYTLLDFGIMDNAELLRHLENAVLGNQILTAAIECVASYGMAVGKSVFDTCIWIGRFTQFIESLGVQTAYVYRMDEKMNLCHNSRAKDGNIRQALIDRFATFDMKNGRGTKKNRDFFYGVSKDVWAAIAVCVTYMDKMAQHG